MEKEKNILNAFNQLRQLLDRGQWHGSDSRLCADAYTWIDANIKELDAVLKKKDPTELKIVKEETEKKESAESEA